MDMQTSVHQRPGIIHLREAAGKDFHLSILSDTCTGADPEVHSVLLTKVFPCQAASQSGGEWAAAIKG